MIDFLQKFELLVGSMRPNLMLVVTVITCSAGVFVWLGGFGFRNIMFAIIGAFCGLIPMVHNGGSNILLTGALIAVGVLLALKLQDFFLSLMVSIIAGVYGFSVLIRPYIDTSGEMYIVLRDLTVGVPFYNWPLLLLMVFAPIAASTTFWRATSAGLCSAAGALLLLFAGIMVSRRFDIAAVGHINSRRELYIEIYIAVLVIGALIQLFLMPKVNRRIIAANKAVKAKTKFLKKSKAKEEAKKSKVATWRTA